MYNEYMLIKMKKRKGKQKNKEENIKCWQGSREYGTLGHHWWGCKVVLSLWKTI
jgi:hypothetical protein